MYTIYLGILGLHASAGAIGLLMFWLPVFYRKGGREHRRYGKVFAWAMQIAGCAGMLMAGSWIIAPMTFRPKLSTLAPDDLAAGIFNARLFGYFLVMLGVLLIANVRHGVLALKDRNDRRALRSPAHVGLLSALALAGLGGVYLGLHFQRTLIAVFGGLSLLNAVGALHYAFKRELSTKEWWIEHGTNMIAAGIGAHTAFFVFGAFRLMSQLIPASLAYLPWILPAIIGVPGILYTKRHYRRLFGDGKRPALQSARSGV